MDGSGGRREEESFATSHGRPPRPPSDPPETPLLPSSSPPLPCPSCFRLSCGATMLRLTSPRAAALLEQARLEAEQREAHAGPPFVSKQPHMSSGADEPSLSLSLAQAAYPLQQYPRSESTASTRSATPLPQPEPDLGHSHEQKDWTLAADRLQLAAVLQLPEDADMLLAAEGRLELDADLEQAPSAVPHADVKARKSNPARLDLALALSPSSASRDSLQLEQRPHVLPATANRSMQLTGMFVFGTSLAFEGYWLWYWFTMRPFDGFFPLYLIAAVMILFYSTFLLTIVCNSFINLLLPLQWIQQNSSFYSARPSVLPWAARQAVQQRGAGGGAGRGLVSHSDTERPLLQKELQQQLHQSRSITLEQRLPRVVAQMPVYTEDFSLTIRPSIENALLAGRAYASQYRTASFGFFLNDDGLLTLSPELRRQRVDYYEQQSDLCYIARAKEGRAGRFKKVSITWHRHHTHIVTHTTDANQPHLRLRTRDADCCCLLSCPVASCVVGQQHELLRALAEARAGTQQGSRCVARP